MTPLILFGVALVLSALIYPAAIGRLAIRGAPLIGVAAAYGVALDVSRSATTLDEACHALRSARPTARRL